MINTTPVRSHDDALAKKLRRFGPVGFLAVVAIIAGNFLYAPLSAILVLVWRWRSGTRWQEIGYATPKSWMKIILAGVLFGVVFKLVMKAMVMPMLNAPAMNQAYHFLWHNPSALPYILYAVIISAGFGEETLYRGYMFERLGKLFGKGTAATIGIIIITSSLFAMAHYYNQGMPGVEQAFIAGLVFGSIYAVRKEIFTVMIAHAAFDVTAVALIYFGLEKTVAHAFFPA